MGLCSSSDHQFYNNICQMKQRINFEDQQLNNLVNLSFQQVKIERAQCCQKNPIKFSVQPNKLNIYATNKSFYVEQCNRQKGFSKGAIFYNDCTFVGCFRDGIPHGQGKSYNKTGQKERQGTWNEGVFVYGQILQFLDENVKKIEILPDLRYKIIFKDRSHYEGQGEITKEGKFFRHGQGIFKNPYKDYQYDGLWNFNKRQGKGKMKMLNTTFDGEFKNDIKQKGIMKVQNKYEYKGQWELVQGQEQVSSKYLFTGQIKNLTSNKTKNVVKNKITAQNP